MTTITEDDLDVTPKMARAGIEAGKEAARQVCATEWEVVTAIFRAMLIVQKQSRGDTWTGSYQRGN